MSYFSNIASLRPGDVLRYVTPCTTYIFHVSSHAIVTQGAPVYNTADPTVTLVTCWPTDALWFTPERYLVTATEVGSVPSGSSTRYITTATPPRVPAPAALVAQGVTLATYSLPMGTFTLGGTPNKGWAQTTNPLLVEGSGVEAFIAAVRSLTEDHLDWWRQLAPGVAAPRALIGAENPDYMTPTNVSEFAWGSNVTSVTLAGTFRVSGGSEPGIYAVSVTERIDAGVLTIASWTMQVA